ncbi:MAG: glycosyltransferase [Atribacterota bacterium]|nr:glycosyltransferase [Atribacterota bacterium]
MMVAFFTNCYKPLINGVVSSIISLKTAFEKKGHSTYIFAPKVEGYTDEEENIFRYHSVNLTNRVKYPIAIPLSMRASKVINEFKPDIIHLHHPFVLSMPAIMYAEKLKIPKILTIHTQYERYAYYISPIPQAIIQEAIKRIIFHLADKIDVITTPSESMKNFINKYKIKKDIVVVPNAINLNLFQDRDQQECHSLKEKFEIKENDTTILYVGRISLEKNIEKIIQAVALIHEKGIINIKLLLVGDGTALEQMKKLVKTLKIDKMVHFAGAVKNEVIKSYYQISDIFAFTSTSETFGLVIIEAMASGLPVLAVKAPGAVDIISDGKDGILSEDDVANFAIHLEKLIVDKNFRNYLSQAALLTAKKYSFDSVADKMLEVYQRLSMNRK